MRMFVLALLGGCLINGGLYEERQGELDNTKPTTTTTTTTTATTTPTSPTGPLDADGDGYTEDVDCDDDDPDVHPDAEEVCDGVDNDCAGGVDNDVGPWWYLDADDDDYGDASNSLQACNEPADHVDNDEDCDDSDNLIHPATLWWEDGDEDGFGAGAILGPSCTAPTSDHIPVPPAGEDDCEDSDPDIHPEAPEVCNGLDDDCNLLEDEEDPGAELNVYYADTDGDGLGDAFVLRGACSPPDDYVSNADDCDDSDPRIGAATAWLYDEDEDGWGAGPATPVSCLPPDAYHVPALDVDDCEDDNPAVFPDQLEICEDGKDQNCSGSDALCHPRYLGPIGMDTVVDVLLGDREGGQAGTAVASAGDLNLDGNGDILVGAWRDNTAGFEAGLVHIMPGPVYGEVSLAASIKLIGEEPGDQAGGSAIGAGDMNGDGWPDLFIGAQHHDNGPFASAGAAYIVYGPVLTDASLSTAVKWQGTFTDDQTGDEVAAAGDVNGDGLADVIVGGEYHDSVSHEDNGVAYLLLGPASAGGDLSDADGRFFGAGDGEQAGCSVGGGGDINGDGYDDLLIGAMKASADSKSGNGSTYVVYGPWVGDLDLQFADVSVHGESNGDEAGVFVHAGGDVNDDGYADLLVGAWREETAGDQSGAVYLLYGREGLSGDYSLAAADAKMVAEGPSARAGRALAMAGDVNGDGNDDLIIGAYRDDTLILNGGTSYLFLGPLDGTLEMSAADGVYRGTSLGEESGNAVNGVGDLDNDGFDDLIIGTYLYDGGEPDAGGAYLLYGGF
jgi:hypothetical protein